MLAVRAAHRRLTERCLVPVTLNDIAELMAVVLCHESSADRNHSLSKKQPADDPRVKSLSIQFFRKRPSIFIEAAGCRPCASRWHLRVVDRSSPAFFNCCARGDKQGTARAIIKIETRADDRAAIACQFRPSIP